ncbi:hypothetical protein COCMIDRAFT_87222 [Bipolaris oryzae ATCC 44560]|uniref:Uncharacterized protein n=1 Tax=Bipolaris oryzae ATCC 44560 TaxID=930090 RepID=W6ZXE8_COCMI|nr:uncharacterized protein COCMIDRAFT_87222 [Bipolaris oryzae ATCC 44560]EUC48531.1 hypothetical protein COCMIDRAFT_87222 [Bipolaris oryzae ATCC 44560]
MASVAPPITDATAWPREKNVSPADYPQVAPPAHLKVAGDTTGDSADASTPPWDGNHVTHPAMANTPIDYPGKLVTPAGYHLGPHGEGWNSPRSSLSRYRHEYSTLSPARRENPKMMGFVTSLVVPTPKTRPDYDVVAEYQGLKLGRISDAVPYLLGPRSIIDRIQVVLEHSQEHPQEHLQPSSSRYTTSSQDTPQPVYTAQDKALMAILTSLSKPETLRLEKGDWYPQGLAARYDALVLYENNASHGIRLAYISLADFIHQAQTWLLAPNPTNKSGDAPHAKNPWSPLAAQLRSKGVDVSKIDLQTYLDLTQHLSASDLAAKLDEIAQWARDGTLDSRFEKFIQEKQEAAAAYARNRSSRPLVRTSGANDTADTVFGGPEALYSKRFTHEYPMGRASEVKVKRQQRSERSKEEVEKSVLANAERMRKMERGRVGGTGVVVVDETEKKKRRKRHRAFFVAFMVVLFGGAVGAMLWAMGTRRWDFTAGGQTQ